jgi:hypothetical protein
LGLQVSLDLLKNLTIFLNNAEQSIGLAAGFLDNGFEILFDG